MTDSEQHFRSLERMYSSAPINRFFATELTVSEGCAELTMPIRPDYFHAANAIHGSVYFKALDDACFFATNSVVEDVLVLTASFNTFLTRPVSSGILRATGRVVHRSRKIILAEAVAFDAEGRQVGRGNGSFMRSSIPLSAELGYV